MNLFGKRKIQFISVILLMLPILTVSSLQAFGYLGNTHPTFTANESDIFIENFTDQVFKDPTTDAEGWGTGTVTSERNFATRLLDFYPTLHPMTDLDVQGRKAYSVGFAMDDSHESVLAFNINNASEIRRTSFRNSLSGMISTAIEGDILYCGFIDSPFSGAHGIARYNVTNPYILNAGGVYIGS
ncbi:MAG: hypothetical protein ACTSSH_02400, partial [Candidatus Heimdallarchaeota archaeon]